MSEILQLFAPNQIMRHTDEDVFYQCAIEKLLKAIQPKLELLRARNGDHTASPVYLVVREWSADQPAKILYFRLLTLWNAGQVRQVSALLGVVAAITNL